MTDDRDRLRTLFASWDRRPGREVVERALEGVPAVAIADLVLDEGEAFWRREACAEALIGRVPGERAAALVDCVCDTEVSARLNSALTTALNVPGQPYSGELRARALERGNYYIAEKLGPQALLDDAKSGDAKALGLLTVLASSPWRHLRAAGEGAVDELIELRGMPAVVAMLGADSPDALARSAPYPAIRLLGLRLLARAGGDISPCLGDDSAIVSRTAYDLLIGGQGHDGTLLAMVEEGRPGHLWALPILHRRGHDIRPMWEGLGSPRVEVPGVPPDVREAIVRRYVPGQRDTDPRWLIEAALLDPPPESYDFGEVRLGAARQALAGAGLEPREPVPAGRSMGSGKGTYHVIPTDAGKVWVSTLGPFFGFEEDARITTALRDAGFRHIDPELGAITFTGLAVYFFGSREPLQVRDLVFYWQD
ncbi:hypothetical protein GCM10010191_73700 [Actinomadura vinacea]|uniref:HEAT repeat domain-containing protein n=1 Tax=Actinomadura vinacea TaxID=115336 RepID=A0ABP5X9G9_9ACTN